MRNRTRFSLKWVGLILVIILAAFGLTACKKGKQTKYEIIATDEIEVLVDREASLDPVLMDGEGNFLDGKFRYEYEGFEQYIAIEYGTITALKPYDGDIEVTIIEKDKGLKKTVTVRIISELSGVLELRDETGVPVDGEIKMTLGQSMVFEAVTLPAGTAIEQYFSFRSADIEGTEKHVFDVSVSQNKVTVTAVGLGKGEMNFLLKNESRHVNETFSYPFTVGFASETDGSAPLGKAVLDGAGKTLLSKQELSEVKRVVFAEDVTQFSAAEAKTYLPALQALIFTGEKKVMPNSFEDLAQGWKFRVKGLDAYQAYRADEAWGAVAERVYPYETDHTKPVLVYHNEGTVRLGGDMLFEQHIYNFEESDYSFKSETSPLLKAVEAPETVEEYAFAGYDFAGWTDAQGVPFDGEDISKVTEGIHLTANWTAKEYTVTLNGYPQGDGENVTVKVAYNGVLPLLADGEKDCWTFVGWYLSKEYKDEEKVDTELLYHTASDLILYAKFTAQLRFFYYQWTGAQDITVPIVYGKPIGESMPEHTAPINGWTFEGWYYGSSCREGEEMTSDQPYTREGDFFQGFSHTLYPKCTYIAKLETFGLAETNPTQLIVRAGKSVNLSLYLEGQDLYMMNLVGKDGWTFKGWTAQTYYEDGFKTLGLDQHFIIDDDETQLTPANAPVLYAIYETENTYVYGPKGAESEKQTVVFGCQSDLLNPELEEYKQINSFDGYLFAGWYLGTERQTSLQQITAEFAGRTYVGKYNAKVYTAHFDFFGQELTEHARTFTDVGTDLTDNVLNNNTDGLAGRVIEVPAVQEKTGYRGFWTYNGKEIAVEEGRYTVEADVFRDVTLVADYEANAYYIHLDTHGISESISKEVRYDGDYSLPIDDVPTPTGTDYDFVGWYLSKEYKEEDKIQEGTYKWTEDITVYAKYTISVSFVEYTRFNAEEDVGGNKSAVFTYGKTAEFDTLDVRGGWSFAGWYYKEDGVEKPVEYEEGTTNVENYTSSVTTYYSRWERKIAINGGEFDGENGFVLPVTEIVVERGKTLREKGISPLPTDGQIEKKGAAAAWTLEGWYYGDGQEVLGRSFDDVNLVNNTSIGEFYAVYTATLFVKFGYSSGVFEGGEYKLTLGQAEVLAALDGEYSAELTADNVNQYFHKGWTIDGVQYRMTEENYATLKTALAFGGKEAVAIFEPISYTVVLNAGAGQFDGGETELVVKDLKYDREYTFTELGVSALVRVGYQFNAWDLNGTVYTDAFKNLTKKDGGKVTLKAVWSPIVYSVEFNANGGEFEGGEERFTAENLKYDKEYAFEDLGLPKVALTGYQLVGWKVGEKIYADAEKLKNLTVQDGDTVALTAVWNAIEYTVQYDPNGGVLADGTGAVKTVGAVYDQAFTPNAHVSKVTRGFSESTGKAWYSFVGWTFTGEDGEQFVYGNEEQLKNLTAESGKTITLCAKWAVLEENIFTVKFVAGENDERELGSQQFTIETTTLRLPVLTEKEGYNARWDLSEMPTGKAGEEFTITAGDKTVRIVYDPISYTLTYLAEDGSVLKRVSYTYETVDTVKKDEVYSQENYPDERLPIGKKFVEWQAVDFDDWTVTEKFVRAEYKCIKYTVCFMDGEREIGGAAYTVDDEMVMPPTLEEKAGYRRYWNFTKAELLEKIAALQDGQTVVTVYAKEIALVYTVTVVAGEEQYQYPYTVEHLIDGKLTLLAPELGEGEQFVAVGATLTHDKQKGELVFAITPETLSDIFVQAKSGEYEFTFVVAADLGYDGLTAYAVMGNGEGYVLPKPTREGYILSGWRYGENFIVADDEGEDTMFFNGATEGQTVALTAVWTPVSYTLSFANCEEMESKTLSYEEEFTLPTTAKTGYIFLGWAFGEEIFAAGESVKNLAVQEGATVALTAVWKAISYNVVYEANGGEETPVNGVAAFGEKFYLAGEITRKGYKFDGWKDQRTGKVYNGGAYVSDLTAVGGDTVVLVAVWQAIKYTVVFENSEQPNMSCEYDVTYDYPAPPARDGYFFVKWLNEKGEEIDESSFSNLSEKQGARVLLTAKWSLDELEEIVFTYIDDYDNELVTKTSGYSVEVPFVNEPKQPDENGKVKGWAPYELADGATPEAVSGSAAEYISIVYTYEGRTAYRIFPRNPQDGETYDLVAPAIPQKTGYTASWQYVEGENGNLTATAAYVLSNEEAYEIFFKDKGGAEVAGRSVAFGELITLPVLEREGYTFLGWRLGDEVYQCGEDVNVNEDGLPSVILTAEWLLLEYKIHFIGTDVYWTYTVESRSADFDWTAAPAVLQKTGYVGEWKLPKLTVGDVEISPVYTPITFTLVFDLAGGDGAFENQAVAYGSERMLGVPTKANSRFIGWKYGREIYSGDTPILMNLCTEQNGTVTLTAVWEKITTVYTATFTVDGEVVASVPFTADNVAKRYLIAPTLPDRSEEGYEGKWADYTLTAADIVIEAEYTAILYKIKYQVGGATVYTAYYTVENKNYVAPSTAMKAGYVFDGWQAFELTVGDVTVEANWVAIEYTVTFDVDGGDSAPENILAKYNEEIILPDAPLRAGYIFAGWSYGGRVYSAGEYLSNLTDKAETVTFVAVWNAIKYTMVIKGVDGNGVEKSILVLYTVEDLEMVKNKILDMNNKIKDKEEDKDKDKENILLPMPKEGYDAIAWEVPDGLPIGGFALKGVYTLIDYYVVFVKPNGQETPIVWTVEAGSISEPHIEGFEWKVEKTNEETGETVYEDYVLTPSAFTWSEKNSRYQLVLTAVTGSQSNRIEFYDDTESEHPIITKYFDPSSESEEDRKIMIPAVPAKKGYVGEWKLDVDENNGLFTVDAELKYVVIVQGAQFTEAVKIYAEYTPIQYTVAFDVNGGEGAAPQNITATYRQPIVMPDAAVRVGYVFGGWGFDGTVYQANEEVRRNFADTQGAVVTLTAVWTPITYTVVFNPNGGAETPQSVTVAYDEEFTLPAAIEHENGEQWQFEKWIFTDELKYVAGARVRSLTSEADAQITLYASWTEKEYVVYFEADGILLEETLICKYDHTLDIAAFPAVPQKEHYKAGVWAWQANATVTGDTVIKAVYEAKTYTISYVVDGEIIETKTYTVEDTAVIAPTVPERSAEGFDGAWESVLLDGGDKTVNAVYTAIEYTVTFYASADEGAEILGLQTYTVENKEISLPALPKDFLAWDMPTLSVGDVKVYPLAALEEGAYIVTFVDELGKTVASVVWTAGKTVEELAPSVPEKAGYAAEWNFAALPETLTENVVVRPVYTVNEYTVTFWKYEKGSAENETVLTVNYTVLDRDIEVPNAAERAEAKAHYTVRWDMPQLTYGDVDVYPAYTPISYTITFHWIDNDGAEQTFQRLYTVETLQINEPACPTRDGYKTARWSEYDLSDLTDMDVYAAYSNIVYKIRYDVIANGETVSSETISDIKYEDNVDIADEEDFGANKALKIPEGYLFPSELCWLDSQTQKKYNFGEVVTKITDKDGDTIVLTLTLTPITYYIEYKVEMSNKSGVTYMTPPERQTVTYDQEITLATYSLPTGYRWSDINGSSWWDFYFDEAYGQGGVCQNLTTVQGETISLTAYIQPITYNVQYNTDGGTAIAGFSVEYDQSFNLAANSATYKKGHFVNVWWISTKNSGYSPNVVVSKLASDQNQTVTITAKWLPCSYTVNFNANGGTVGTSSKTVTYGETYGSLPTPTRSGYTFDGWYFGSNKISDSTTVSVDENHTLTASWTEIPSSGDSGGGDGECFTGDTLVALADGTYARLDSLKAGDLVLTWNAFTGTVEAMPISLFWNHGEGVYDVISLTFSNGKVLKVVTEHGFFDSTLNKFVYINAKNYADYIGHEFAYIGTDGKIEDVRLVSAVYERKLSSSYSLRSACNDNVIVEGFLTLTVEDIKGFLTYFEFGEDYKYDQAKLEADIAKYGLYTYDEWKDYGSYEEFVALNGKYLKILIGKGYLTYEDILILIEGMRQGLGG